MSIVLIGEELGKGSFSKFNFELKTLPEDLKQKLIDFVNEQGKKDLEDFKQVATLDVQIIFDGFYEQK
jgi:hypothetical protein